MRQVIARLTGVHAVMASLLYGSGLRLLECLRLRVEDVDVDRRALCVRDAKGNEDRATMSPGSPGEPLMDHLRAVRRLHEDDLARGCGAVRLPDALDRKMRHLCAFAPLCALI